MNNTAARKSDKNLKYKTQMRVILNKPEIAATKPDVHSFPKSFSGFFEMVVNDFNDQLSANKPSLEERAKIIDAAFQEIRNTGHLSSTEEKISALKKLSTDHLIVRPY